MISGVFVTGTDTGVGKTLVSAWLTQGWKATYWKPIQSGFPPDDDADEVKRLTGCVTLPSVVRLRAPLSPHEAARREGRNIAVQDFSLPDIPDLLVVEGAGGVLVPLNDREMMVDLIVALGLPVVIAARGTLGTVNHTLLTLEALRARRVPVLGIVFSGPLDEANRVTVTARGKCPILGAIPPLTPPDPQTLASCPPPPALALAMENLS